MKLRNAGRYILIAAAGLIVFVTGLVLAAISRDADGIMKTLPFILVGVGSGIFGGNIGTALKKKEMFKHPEAAKQMEIEPTFLTLLTSTEEELLAYIWNEDPGRQTGRVPVLPETSSACR